MSNVSMHRQITVELEPGEFVEAAVDEGEDAVADLLCALGGQLTRALIRDDLDMDALRAFVELPGAGRMEKLHELRTILNRLIDAGT